MTKRIKVFAQFSKEKKYEVGAMLESVQGKIYFQFSSQFLETNLSISPFKLKALVEPQTPSVKDTKIFEGLFGVFADSLPDGYGLLLMSKALKKMGKSFLNTSPLDKLCYIGDRAMGALSYEPDFALGNDTSSFLELGKLAHDAMAILEGDASDVLLELMMVGGSPGGARPKALIGLDPMTMRIVAGASLIAPPYEAWMVKFHSQGDDSSAGVLEYIYSQVARKVGIDFPETRLLKDGEGRNWFAVKRFDRLPGNRRVHMHSAAGILHADFRLPCLDYRDLMALTSAITKSESEVLKMFRLVCYNVIFHNRDDHAKNFAFLMDERGEWRLAPAFDLTWSHGPGGEHTTSVLGEGKSLKRHHLLDLAKASGLPSSVAKCMLEEVENGRAIFNDLLHEHGLNPVDYPNGFS